MMILIILYILFIDSYTQKKKINNNIKYSLVVKVS